ncbi:MAG TPA: 5'/3'-nucleotidase SurE [Verrucomicrobiae bacterium]|nr:5'/3'-nucleotidase SurE [Verrucomicrobiae bacterium]
MNILVTNDDGIHSRGIEALAVALEQAGAVAVVAPDREQSAIGHAITLHHPLRATRLRENWFSVSGTPTDCVNLGIHNLLGFRPDLVVSGINRGANLADDITYSGTVSAAMEAMLMGIPSMAVSLVTGGAGENYDAAASVACRIARAIGERGLPPDTFLNVNVPDLPEERLKPPLVTRQGKKAYQGAIVDNVDPRGNRYYWIGSIEPSFLPIPGCDHEAVAEGHVSITPLHVDLTNYAAMEALRGWRL